jgi:hypothetical protein
MNAIKCPHCFRLSYTPSRRTATWSVSNLEADNAKLRAALEAAAVELKGVASIASTVTSGKAANAINAVRIIKETAIEAERACWVALGDCEAKP